MPPVFHVGLLMWLPATRMPRRITDVASSNCPWRYWIIISVIMVQYRHRRLWRSQWIRHVRSSTTPHFWWSIFRHKIVIDQPLWWFSDKIRGSLVSTFLVDWRIVVGDQEIAHYLGKCCWSMTHCIGHVAPSYSLPFGDVQNERRKLHTSLTLKIGRMPNFWPPHISVRNHCGNIKQKHVHLITWVFHPNTIPPRLSPFEPWPS
jgi:hypothetical protein